MQPRWGDFDRTLALMDEFRRRMDRVFDEYDGASAPRGVGFPRTSLSDEGAQLVLLAEVPGLSERDVKLTLNQDVLTLEGERRVDAPKDYSVHRQERAPVRFARSVTLPCKVDVERVSAVVRDGLLTVTLPKAPEARPRQISVRAQ